MSYLPRCQRDFAQKGAAMGFVICQFLDAFLLIMRSQGVFFESCFATLESGFDIVHPVVSAV